MASAAYKDRTFEQQTIDATVSATRLGSVLAAIAIPSGVILDELTHPEQVADFLLIRLVSAILALLVLPLTYTPVFQRHPGWPAAALSMVCQGGVLVMMWRLGGYGSPYYAGLNATILAFCLLYNWHWKYMAFLCGSTVTLWVGASLFGIRGATFDPRTFSNNLYFLVLTSGLAIAASAVRFRLAREEFNARSSLARASSDLVGTLERLRELDRFKSEFFANITHELKTPLTMILAPLELMIQGEMGKLTEPQRGSLQSMLRSGVKLLKLIGDLLDLSKLTESRLRLRVAEHDLVSYLRELVGQVQPLAQRKSIELSFESNVETCRIFCDLERLERVFVNLLSNAAKFTHTNGNIDVVLQDNDDSVAISVTDDGTGFPPEMAEALFDRFFQVDMTGTRKFGGTGIGLSLAREFVLLHGGKIRGENAPVRGAIFTVDLLKGQDHFDPSRIDRRARHEDRAFGMRETDHDVGDWNAEAKSQFRFIDIDEATDQRVVGRDVDEQERAQSVLVIEDTPDVIRVIHLALRNHFRVLAAPRGDKGIELATRYLPNLIITDLMMPGMDGMEVTRRLRADARTRHIPIVMLTARGDTEDRVAGLEAGVSAYLTKPFSTRELVTTVRGLVRIQETTADLVLTHSMDSLETIAGGLAHELNNPLNYMKNALSLIEADAQALVSLAQRDLMRDENSEPARQLSAAVTRMGRMFQVTETGLQRIGATVTLMQRYSREGYSRVLQPRDAFEAARDVVAVLQAGVERSQVQTSFDGDGRVVCVPEEFNQMLTNLIQNALDAIPPDGTGRVLVKGSSKDGSLTLTVSDNGSGIRPEERARIFTPFYTTKDVGKGMGLGLTIVRRVVASLGGTVEVGDRAGGGTEFTLRIPQERQESRTGATVLEWTSGAHPS